MRALRQLIVIFITILIGSISPGARVGAQEETRSSQNELAEWIMQKVVEKSLENEILKRQYITYDKYQTTENLAKQPPMIKRETYNIFGENGHSMERLVELNGRAVREKAKSSNLDFSKMLAEKYLPRMKFEKIREEMINGKGYFVITFAPKSPPNQLPENDLYDRGINRSSGTIYIDMEKLYIWKIESSVIEGFSAYFLGRAENFQLNVLQEEKFGIVVPKTTIVEIRYKILWIITHERRISIYGNHHDLRDPAAQPN